MKKKYKPFNLKEAKEGAKVITRDGHIVDIWRFDDIINNKPITGYVILQYGRRWFTWFENGIFNLNGTESRLDLVMCIE